VLSDESIRSAAKQYAQWPTFPQVWVRGELIGGNDIVAELHATGELARMVEAL
jgi:monothiol glutaredoxin